jgi:hypothetical protein
MSYTGSSAVEERTGILGMCRWNDDLEIGWRVVGIRKGLVSGRAAAANGHVKEHADAVWKTTEIQAE